MSVSSDFADRTVIVTGGSSGIGRAAARLFGDAGATVVVADVREDPKDLGEEAGYVTGELLHVDGGWQVG